MANSFEILSSDSPGSFEYSRGRITATLEKRIPGAGVFAKMLDTVGEKPFFVSRVVSTNDLLKTRIRSGEDGILFIVCDGQTKGRGTGRRHWSDRFGCDVLFSVSDEIPESQKRYILPLIIGASIASNLETLLRIKVQVKWPNDLVVGKRKLGGILIDVIRGTHIVVGVGLNTRSRMADFPDYLRTHATTMLEELPGNVPPDDMIWNSKLDRLPVLIAACSGVLRALEAFKSGDWSELVKEFSARDATPGSHRYIENPDGTSVFAECRSVDLETGEMVVRMPNGDLRRISSAKDLIAPEDTTEQSV